VNSEGDTVTACSFISRFLAASRVHEEEVFERSIDVQILRLRRKLEADPSAPKLIVTERGAGYRFAVDVELQSTV
jgi:DNA-binding response OmpR family regulator